MPSTAQVSYRSYLIEWALMLPQTGPSCQGKKCGTPLKHFSQHQRRCKITRCSILFVFSVYVVRPQARSSPQRQGYESDCAKLFHVTVSKPPLTSVRTPPSPSAPLFHPPTHSSLLPFYNNKSRKDAAFAPSTFLLSLRRAHLSSSRLSPTSNINT